jgi:hypothetical protein
MKIEGSIRSNLISAITSVRRWEGRVVHKDTLTYWNAVLDHGVYWRARGGIGRRTRKRIGARRQTSAESIAFR